MARKPKRGNGPAAGGFVLSDLEALLASLARLPDMPQDDALEEAQEIAFEAMEARTAKRRIALARKALAISPLCADALVVLAREEKDPAAALKLLREAAAAGEKALGPEIFEQDAGHFWGLLETRPYMRARHVLAMALREAGEDEEAIGHYRDMLRLNPNDNQGIRDLLMDALLERGRDDEAETLLKRYGKDSSAAWAWSRTLLAYRRHGDGATARKALARAMQNNPHVPPYLLGSKRMPKTPPAYDQPGAESEAVSYLEGGAQAWRAAPGALAWLADALANGAAQQASGRRKHPAHKAPS
jgi:tetratricopeptide (TPR) repeat protein